MPTNLYRQRVTDPADRQIDKRIDGIAHAFANGLNADASTRLKRRTRCIHGQV